MIKSLNSNSYTLSTSCLTKHFEGVHALTNCSLKVQEGTITGLIGPNGAGKSTLFNILAGKIKANSGKISLFGDNITEIDQHRLFKLGVVRTFQLAQVFSDLTAMENLMVVPDQQLGESLLNNWLRLASVKKQELLLRTKARKVLSFLKLDDKRHHLAGSLSGGQKKLLELGRTMMIENPKLILLDEVAAGVNRALLKIIISNIQRLNKEKNITFFVIEHDMSMIESICDKVFVMANGTIIDQGDFADIRKNPKVLNAYFGTSEITITPSKSC